MYDIQDISIKRMLEIKYSSFRSYNPKGALTTTIKLHIILILVMPFTHDTDVPNISQVY